MPRHRVSPSASPMTGSGGASSTPRLCHFHNRHDVLDHSPSRMMTMVGTVMANQIAKILAFTVVYIHDAS